MNKNITIGATPAYHSYHDDGKKHPGLILIHEIWGLDDHIKNVTDRFAAQGYSVIAPNLFHGMSFEGKVDNSLLNEMHNPETRDEAQKKMRALFAPIQAPEFATTALAQLKACVDYILADEHTTGDIGVLGFCFGGTYSFHLAAQDSRINVCAVFYGQPPKPEEISQINCPILAFYGEQDTGLMQSLPQLKDDMKGHDKKFEAIVYPNTGHAFFNDTNARMYNASAAHDAWGKTLAFFAEHLTAK